MKGGGLSAALLSVFESLWLAVRDTRRTVAALYDTPFGRLVVYGAVLPWHTDRGHTGTAKNWTEQYRVVPQQAEEWAALRQRIRQRRCVSCDLNMNLGGSHYYGTKNGRALLQQPPFEGRAGEHQTQVVV